MNEKSGSMPQTDVAGAELAFAPAQSAPAAIDAAALHPALQATILAARYYGVELDPNEYSNAPGEAAPSAVAVLRATELAP